MSAFEAEPLIKKRYLELLAPDGWELDTEHCTVEPILTVALMHKLYPSLQFCGNTNRKTDLETEVNELFRVIVRSAPVALVRSAMGVVSHFGPVVELRIRASAEGWSGERFKSECDVALDLGRISPSERDWLIAAGPV